jgi:hypothetical protein
MVREPIRYRRARYGSQLVRRVVRAGQETEITVAREYGRSGRWGELIDADDLGSWIAVPGGRDLTVAEYVAEGARRIRRYGDWIEINRDVAATDQELLRWCRRHADSELQTGEFLLKPADWDARHDDALDLPFIPEFDHPDEVIRDLATAEAWRRDVAFYFEVATDWRRDAVAGAARAGHSRRALGRLLDLSFARIQQLAAEAESEGTRTARRRPRRSPR